MINIHKGVALQASRVLCPVFDDGPEPRTAAALRNTAEDALGWLERALHYNTEAVAHLRAAHAMITAGDTATALERSAAARDALPRLNLQTNQ